MRRETLKFLKRKFFPWLKQFKYLHIVMSIDLIFASNHAQI